MADDSGKWVHSALPYPLQLQKPFFYNKAIYAVAHMAGRIDTVKFELGRDGRATGFEELAETEAAGCHSSLATCVYRGQAYLFYDSETRPGARSYNIKYKTATNPKNWLPADANGLATGITGEYADWKFRGDPPCIGAREMDDKIWLFYRRQEETGGYQGYIHYASYDGDKWQPRGKLLPLEFHPIFALCTATVEEQPMIVFAGFARHDTSNIWLVFMDAQGKVVRHLTVPANWVVVPDMLSIAQGTIKDGPQRNVLQIFGQNSGMTRRDLRRLNFNLQSFSPDGEWSDTLIDRPSDGPVPGYPFCDVVCAATPLDTKAGHFQQHIVVLNHRPAQIHSYASDHFKCVHKGEIQTGSHDTEQPEAWTVLGVVEGVPPFTRNGIEPAGETATVQYGQSETHTIKVVQQSESSVSLAAGGGIDKVFSAGVELKGAFSVANELWKTAKAEVSITLTNTLRNNDGGYGWLILSKPKLEGRRFSRLSYDQKVTLGTFLMVSVVELSIAQSAYPLGNPPKGMATRPASSKLEDWLKSTFPSYPGVKVLSMNALTSSLHGDFSAVTLMLGDGSARTTTGSAQVRLQGSLSIKQLFNIESSETFSWTQAVELSSEFSKWIGTTLKLIGPASPTPKTVVELSVGPYWIVPEQDAKLLPSEKPFWLPDAYVPKGVIPWCLSWRVHTIKMNNGTVIEAD